MKEDKKLSRFRIINRTLTVKEKNLHDEIKNKAGELEKLYEKLKPGDYKKIAITSLESSVMWAIKQLTI